MALPDRSNGPNTSRGAQASPPPKGIYVPVPTFFVPESSASYNPITPPLDLETQSKHTLFLVRGGIKGLVLLGSTGEAIFIRSQERHKLISSQRKTLDENGFKDRPIIAGTATQQIDDTLALIEDSKAAGAEYAMVLAPGYFASSTNQSGIQRWFEAVADKAALPILIYHYPGVTNNLYIAPATFEALAKHPNIAGTKLSHGQIDDATLIASNPRIDHEHFHTYTGLGQNLLPFLTLNGAGAIDALAAIFPRVLVRLFRLFNDSAAKGTTKADIDQMRELQFRICEGEKLVAKWGVVGIKEGLARVWRLGDGKGGRVPLAGGWEEEGEWERWEGLMGGLKEMEESLEKEGRDG